MTVSLNEHDKALQRVYLEALAKESCELAAREMVALLNRVEIPSSSGERSVCRSAIGEKWGLLLMSFLCYLGPRRPVERGGGGGGGGRGRRRWRR